MFRNSAFFIKKTLRLCGSARGFEFRTSRRDAEGDAVVLATGLEAPATGGKNTPKIGRHFGRGSLEVLKS
jgi:hypothetical protein